MLDSMEEKNELRLAVRNAREAGCSIGQIIEEVLDELDLYNENYMSIDFEISERSKTTTKEMTSENVKYEVTKVINEVGMPAAMRGYDYVRYAVIYSIENPTALLNVTKELYPAVAKEFNTTIVSVERNIRHAIEAVWKNGNIEKLKNLFGYGFCNESTRQKNSNFIAMIVDSMKVKYNWN